MIWMDGRVAENALDLVECHGHGDVVWRAVDAKAPDVDAIAFTHFTARIVHGTAARAETPNISLSSLPRPPLRG